MKNLKSAFVIKTLIFISVVLSSCNQQETSPASLQGIYPIDITELIDPPEKAEDWIDEIIFIPLETNEESLLSARMRPDMNEKLILCTTQTSVSLFDHSGKHKTSFSKVGKGPGEYGRISEACFLPGTDHILVADNMNRKAVVYNADGSALHEFQIPFQWWDIIPLDDQTIALYMSKALTPDPVQEQRYEFILMDMEGNIDGGFMPYTHRMGAPYPIQLSKLSWTGPYVTAPSFQYMIYQLGPGKLFKKLYQFDFGKDNIDTTLVNNPEFLKKTPTVKDFGEGIPNLEHMAMTSNSVLFFAPKRGLNRAVMRLVNRNTGNQRSLIMDSLFNAGYYHGFPVYIFPTHGIGDYLVTVREAIDVFGFIADLDEDQKNKLSGSSGFNQLQALKAEDNPIMILYKLKDF